MQPAKRLAAFVLSLIIFSACNNSTDQAKTSSSNDTTDTGTIDGHPAWAIQGNIYEVNVRQYTPEGTFNAFAKNLDRLKAMGVQTLWFMPINPISKKDRKGVLGSYYAVADYTAINPEFGTMADWNALVAQAHEKGFKIIIDWVPNHTGADHYWLDKHPDFYKKDSTGKPAVAYDWTDTRKLNYGNPELEDSMINSMKYWLTSSKIDGFRCDVAGDVPDSFWKKAIPILKKQRNIFMLAEGNKPALQFDGFDATYSWDQFAMMTKIAKGVRPAFALDSVINKADSTFPPHAMYMYFTSNHDENSWNKADYGTMPGSIHAPFAVLTQTIGRSIPLIYSGQEEPVLDSISFFYKNSISFGKYQRAGFYTTLLELRKSPALAANAAFKRINAGDSSAIYAYSREAGGKKILVMLNLSAKEQVVKLTDPSLYGEPYNVFMKGKEKLSDKEWKMPAWGYKVYVY